MATISTSGFNEPPQLQQLAHRLRAWRAARVRGQRIPEKLWQAAAKLASSHGLSATATALQLSYYDLQRRLLSLRPRTRARHTPPSFVELPAPAPALGVGVAGTVEVVQASGARLILRLPNANPRELLCVVQLFLRRRL
jgi:hypothetical protein